MRPLIIINSGDRNHASRSLLERFESELSNRLAQHRLVLSRSIAETRELIGDAAQNGFDTVIAGGGDGTLNAVLNELPLDGMALGVLPLGTVNCFARAIGLALDPMTALRQVLDGAPRKISCGTINGRRFICFCSIGFDAAIVHQCNLTLKRLIREGAYLVSGVKVFTTLRGVQPFRLSGDCPIERLHSLMISQIPVYGGFRLFPAASPEYSRLEACALLRRSRADLLRMLCRWPAYARQPDNAPPAIRFLQFAKIRAQAEQALCVQIDGEPVTLENSTDLTIEVLPQAVSFIYPRA